METLIRVQDQTGNTLLGSDNVMLWGERWRLIRPSPGTIPKISRAAKVASANSNKTIIYPQKFSGAIFDYFDRILD